MTLLEEMVDRLLAAGVADDAVDLVLAAMEGASELESVLAGESAPMRPATVPVGAATAAPGVYLQSIDVTGFRGIGPKRRLELTPGPGLTVVAGRNGSGKSSFVEALEVLLTGDSWRWKGKTADWHTGWRNLHVTDPPSVSATFLAEGDGRVTVDRVWDPGAKTADQGSTTVHPTGKARLPLDEHPWAPFIDLYRPLLSHPELGVIADRPADLFDAISAVLGLDPLNEAADLLRRTRLDLEKPHKTVTKDLKDRVLPTLETSDDPRAAVALAALSGRTRDLSAAAAQVGGTSDVAVIGEGLLTLSRLRPLDADQVEVATDRLGRADLAVAEFASTDAARARRTADLLRAAVDHHAEHGDEPCPVCGGKTLDSTWSESASGQITELQEVAARFDGADHDRSKAFSELRRLVMVPAIPDVDGIDTDTCRDAWGILAHLPEDPASVVEHVRSTASEVARLAEQLAAEAGRRIAQVEDAWRPVATVLAGWLDRARAADLATVHAQRVETAEKALRAVIEDVRSDRFSPISDQAIALWRALRLQSNVDLIGVELHRAGNNRRVDLQVTVDGVEASALGVVSQGEINCLALSLFFPRVMLPDSPFRFIVLDDPVQAMDPARVDGLAKVLSDIAKTHQLVVFTHDDRLPESLRRLALQHRVLTVRRRAGSDVEIIPSLDPVKQYFVDARAVERDDRLPDGVAQKVVPGFCRSGIEAACMEVVRRRRIGRGDSHASVERALSEVRRTTELMSLALFDDGGRGGEVLGEMNRKFSPAMTNAFKDASKGAHGAFHGPLEELISECQSLAERVRALT